MVFEGDACDYQPFSYLNDYNPVNFRLATSDEIERALNTDNDRIHRQVERSGTLSGGMTF